MSRLMSKFRRLIRGAQASSGISAVEFALAAVALTVMIVPTVDLGLYVYGQMQVEDAAQAGAQYALQKGTSFSAPTLSSTDISNIGNAVTTATTYPSMSAKPDPVESYGCANGTSITVVVSTTICPGNLNPGRYVTVAAQAPYTPLFSYPVLGSGTITLAAQTKVRIQ